MRPLSSYVHSAPTDQNALDIFAGDWTSLLPDQFSHLRAGTLPLFVDPRMHWAIQQLGGVTGKRILELGPLEGAHSYILEMSGAEGIVAVESNAAAFLRCLVLKEILGLRRVRYLCGDFSEYLRTGQDQYDIVVASGILYHQLDPVSLIANISRVASAVYIWTHYFDDELVKRNPALNYRVGVPEIKSCEGFTYSQAEYRYEESLDWSGSCGGTHTSSYWLPRQDILNALTYFGFRDLVVAYDEPTHKHGPSMAIVAQK